MNYRKATKDDIDKIIELRMKMLKEEATFKEVDISAKTKEYFELEFDNSLVIYVAEDEDEIISTIAVIFQNYPPSFGNPEGFRAYITNAYTTPSHRRKGISTKLMDLLIAEIKAKNISYVWVWATAEGRFLYEHYGFKDVTAFSTMDYCIKL